VGLVSRWPDVHYPRAGLASQMFPVGLASRGTCVKYGRMYCADEQDEPDDVLGHDEPEILSQVGGKKCWKVGCKKRPKKSSTPKSGLKLANHPKRDPKRPVKQGTLKIGTHPKRRAPKLVSTWAQSYTYVQHSALGGCQSERPKRMGRYP
jgi:hypothetical protein